MMWTRWLWCRFQSWLFRVTDLDLPPIRRTEGNDWHGDGVILAPVLVVTW